MRDVLGSIDLNLLYTFLLVVDAGGIGRAAQLLSRSQPAVTMRLKLLEEALGGQLLQRAGRGVQPTMLGRALLDDIRAIVAHARAVVDTARSGSATPAGSFRVGALPMVGVHLLAPALAELAREHARVDFELRPAFIGQQIEELQRGRIDVAFTVGAADAPGLAAEELGQVRAVLVARAEDAPRQPVSIATLAKRELIGYGDVADPFFQAIQRFLDEHGLGARVRFRVPHIPTIKALVRAGAGVACLPDYTVVEPDLVARQVRGLTVAQPLFALFRASIRALTLVDGLFTRVRARLARRG